MINENWEKYLYRWGQSIRGEKKEEIVARDPLFPREIFQGEAVLYLYSPSEQILWTKKGEKEERKKMSPHTPLGFAAYYQRSLFLTLEGNLPELEKIYPEVSFDSFFEGHLPTAYIPLLGEEELEGVLLVRPSKVEPFNQEERKTLHFLAFYLAQALAEKREEKKPFSRYSYLFEKKLIDDSILRQAYQLAYEERKSPEWILMCDFEISRSHILESLSRFYGLESTAYTEEAQWESSLLESFAAETLEFYQVFPLKSQGDEIILLMENPADNFKLRELETLSDLKLRPQVAIREDIFSFLEAALGDSFSREEKEEYKILEKEKGESEPPPPPPPPPSSWPEVLEDASDEVFDYEKKDDQPSPWSELSPKEDQEDKRGDFEEEELYPMSSLFKEVLREGIKRGASHIHIEPERDGKFKVRFRIEGEMSFFSDFSGGYAGPFIAQAKQVTTREEWTAGKAQKGYFEMDLEGSMRHFAVSLFPTEVEGEEAVIEILEEGYSPPPTWEELDIEEEVLTRFQKDFTQGAGLFFFAHNSGIPYLYSAARMFCREKKKVYSLCRQKKYSLEGLREIGSSSPLYQWKEIFQNCLQADGDALITSEIYSRDLLEISLGEVLKGKMILAAFPSLRAGEVLERCLLLGLSPWDLSAMTRGIVAGRQFRGLCQACREKREVREEERNQWRAQGGEGEPVFYQALGCEECNQSGYGDSFSLHEYLSITKDVRQFLSQGNLSQKAEGEIRRQGGKTLDQRGREAVVEGKMSWEEYLQQMDRIPRI